MHENKGSLDLRDRQLVLQQVANFLAAVHTVGSNDKLCLWGSFVGKSEGLSILCQCSSVFM